MDKHTRKLTLRRKERLRTKLQRVAAGRLRLSVHRSNMHIFAQVIDDAAGKTLASASSQDTELKAKLKHGANVSAAKMVGELVAKRATAAGVTTVVFDRGAYRYHGRIKALAEAAREAGLAF